MGFPKIYVGTTETNEFMKSKEQTRGGEMRGICESVVFSEEST